MSLRIASKEKPVENFLTSLIEAYPDASMRDIAVLFTDVVGSTNFFKTHGDLRGREMLRTHHNMAMSIVEEYGGSLIKEVGDSVLVYFPDPKEALKAAIMMQHKFLLHNREGGPNDEIHVRIGLHYGKVIVEEKDIYGDVVNVAAKLTNLANGDQIFVSDEVYNTTKEVPSINFELTNFWNMKNVPTGLTIYKVDWENAPVTAPSRSILVLIIPDLSGPDANRVGEAMGLLGEEKENLHGIRHISVKKTKNNMPVFIYENSAAALDASKKMFSWISERSGEKEGPPPVKIFITGTTPRMEKEILSKGPDAQITGLDQCGIYMTGEICQEIRSHHAITGTVPPVIEPSGPFFQLLFVDGAWKKPDDASPSLPIQKNIFDPCFYCGSRRHQVSGCPSKSLTEPGRSIMHLGYLPMQKIEEIAMSLDRLPGETQAADNITSFRGPSGGDTFPAHALYDLKVIYQFRFSPVIWNSKAQSWDKIRTGQAENQGGFVWLAQDSLRVSNHEKAESFLKLAMERNPKDYKIYCVLGFLDIERCDHFNGIRNFSKALELARTNPQKIYISLMLSRLYKLSGNHKKAGEMITSVLAIDGGCVDAVYQDIVLKLDQDKDRSALARLARLVRENKEFFVIALIDPDVSYHRNSIYAHLTEVLAEAEKDALHYLDEAKRELSNARSLLPVEVLKNIDPALFKVEELVRSGGYFAYLDTPHHCSAIKTMCRSALKEQVDDILGIMNDLDSRIEKARAFIKSYRYPHLAGKYKNRLSALKASLNNISDVRSFDTSDQFEACRYACETLSDQLSGLESKLEMLDLVQQAIHLCLKFLKNSSIFFSIVFFLGIFIFPFMTDHINALLEKFDISAFPNAWAFQKSFLIFGGVMSLIVSFFMTVKELFGSGSGHSR